MSKTITIGSDAHLLGIQQSAKTIYVGRTNRFGADIGSYKNAIQEVEAFGYARRVKLYDLYTAAMMDCHLQSVVSKRKSMVLSDRIEFVRDGVVDKDIEAVIESPWFARLMSDALDSIFWGFTLVQFVLVDGWLDYELIPRKHVDPIHRLILRRQDDTTGIGFNEFDDLFFIGDPRDLGLLAPAVPWTIYKRNSVGDWAQYAELFGMPIQEYTYDAADREMREQIERDAYDRGGLGIIIHPEGSNLNLIEPSDKGGSSGVYSELVSMCNAEMSKLILGNTLTTEAGKIGTQALGVVQKEGEDDIIRNDRGRLLNMLNYDLCDVFARFGLNTTGGKFQFAKPEDLSITTWVDTAIKLHALGVPLDSDQVYERTGFRRPSSSSAVKREQALEAADGQSSDDAPSPSPPISKSKDRAQHRRPMRKPSGKDKTSLQRALGAIRDFFVFAPSIGGGGKARP